MRNYTAQIRILDHAINLETVKHEVERVLLRAHPRLTYKLGGISYTGQNDLFVEVASDAKKEYLTSVLKGLETILPLKLRQVGWGWLVTTAAFPQDKNKIGYLGWDPFAGLQPQLEATRVYEVKKRTSIKIFALFGLMILTILAYLLNMVIYIMFPALFDRYSLLVNMIFFFGFSLEIMIGLPVIPWKFPRRIQCDPGGIEIQYWLSSSPIRLEWKEILSLELFSSTHSRYSLHSAKTKHALQFIDSQSLGPGEQTMLVKTIIERAALHLVEVNMGKVVYKQFDAP